MGFSLQPNNEGRSQVVLTNEPPYIVPFQIAPSSAEKTLMEGKWLIVSFSIWSMHDLEAAHRAISVTKQHGGRFRLGLRPFDYPEENLSWLPITSEATKETVDLEVAEQQGKRVVAIKGRTDTSPVWATIINGLFATVRFGQLSEMDLGNLIKDLLAVGGE